MDRRGFFKRLGMVAGASLVPFKWKLNEPIIITDNGQEKPLAGSGIQRVMIDGLDVTSRCIGIEAIGPKDGMEPFPPKSTGYLDYVTFDIKGQLSLTPNALGEYVLQVWYYTSTKKKRLYTYGSLLESHFVNECTHLKFDANPWHKGRV